MIKISEIFDIAPLDTRGSLESKTYQTLENLGIEFTRVDNESVEAMEDCFDISQKLGAQIRKSILVSNRKKTEFHLVILPADKSFDTKIFCEKLGCSRVSFASGETMQDVLGIEPGALTVMSILNDTSNKVKVVIDKEVANDQWFACNPGANTTHIKIKTDDLLKLLLPKLNHRAIIVQL